MGVLPWQRGVRRLLGSRETASFLATVEKLVLPSICALLPSGRNGQLSFGGHHGALKGQNKEFWLQLAESWLSRGRPGLIGIA